FSPRLRRSRHYHHSVPTRRSSDLAEIMAAPGKNTAVLDNVTAPLRKYLDDESVTELVINLPQEVGVERKGRWSWESEPTFDFKTDRKSTRLNSSHVKISYAVFCLK